MVIPPSCCHAALLLNAAIWLDNADSTVTQPKCCQKNHLGKQGHLAEGCWRLRRLCLLTALAIMKHLVYQTPTEGGREQGSRGWEKEEWEKTRQSAPHSVSSFLDFHGQIFTQIYRGEEAIWQKLPLPWQQKKNGHNKARAMHRHLTAVVLPRLERRKQCSNLAICSSLILCLQRVSKYLMSKCRIQTTTLPAAEGL